MNWSPLLLLILCGLTLTVSVGSVSASGEVFSIADDQDLDPDDIVLEIHINESSAEWIIEYRYRLSEETEVQAFAELEDDIEAEESAYLNHFTERMNRTVETAQDSTGREMSISNVSVTTEMRSIPQEYGIVRYSFEWENFATVEAHRIEVGDAIAGLFLDDNTNLRISWADAYRLSSVSPEPSASSEQSVTWYGPFDFDRSSPHVSLEEDRNGGLPYGSLVAVGLLLLFVAGGWMLVNHRGTKDEVIDESPEESLLSNEERVLRVIGSEGGRIKQQEVVERLGWTDARTSQVVSELREQGKVESFRLGRENVLRIPEEED